MMLIVVLAAILANAAGAPTEAPHFKHCIHTNTDMISADNVISNIVLDMDNKTNHIITVVEMIDEFIGKFDENRDSRITRQEFVHRWYSRFSDIPDFANYLFDHFDLDRDGVLGVFDFPILHSLIDIDHDGMADEIEFTLYMLHLYEDCVPHFLEVPTF